MTIVNAIAQPTHGTTLDAIREMLAQGPFDELMIAAAYCTNGGVKALLEEMRHSGDVDFDATPKKWVTSFDYTRTDPPALRSFRNLPNSEVRIHGAQACLSNKCYPKVPFHPKAFLFKRDGFHAVLAGSGNISYSGLNRGFEAGLAIHCDSVDLPPDDPNRQAITRLLSWYSDIWDAAAPLDDELLARYEALYERQERLKYPTPTDDDVATGDASVRAISDEGLQKLRRCGNLWIQSDKVTNNRGKLPGNQLMMKRMTRVFFGCSSKSVPEDTFLTYVKMRLRNGEFGDFSLTYSNNKMDKLVLPIPGAATVPTYEYTVLLFERLSANSYGLKVFPQSEIKKLRAKSEKVGAAFKMSGGREWGVF